MLGQEDFEGVQLLRNAFNVVQAINPNNQLDALELLLECRDPLLNLRVLESFFKLLRIDSDGESRDRDDLTLELDTVRRCCGAPGPCQLVAYIYRLYSQDARATAQEMPRVVIGVEADQVAVQETQEYLVPDRQDPVDFRAGEGSMQEEPDFDVLLVRALKLFAQHGGK